MQLVVNNASSFTEAEAKSMDLLGIYVLALPVAATMLCGTDQQKIDEKIGCLLWLAVNSSANTTACQMSLNATCDLLEISPPFVTSKALFVHAIAVSRAAIILFENHKKSESCDWLFCDWDYSSWLQFLLQRGRDRYSVTSPSDLQAQLQKNLEIISK